MKEIRCAFISSYYGPYYSNYVASVIELEKEMQKHRYKTVYVFPKEVQNFEWIHCLEELTDKIYYLEYAPYSIQNVLSLRNIFKLEKINVVYSRFCGWDFTARFAAPFIPIVWHMDMNVNLVNRFKRLKNWIKFRIIALGKTYHVAVSYPVGDIINSLKPKNVCKVIPNALDFSRLHIKTNHFFKLPYKVLIFGWAPEVKGLDIALKACEILNKEEVQVILLVSAQRKTYEFIYEKYSLIPEWLKLFPPTDNIATLYDKADVMLSASRSESFSYCLAEAIYSGLPVVYSDIKGTSWANEFKSAYEFKTEDVNDLIRALRKCFLENVVRENVVYNYKKMEEKYSMNSWTKSILEFIESVV